MIAELHRNNVWRLCELLWLLFKYTAGIPDDILPNQRKSSFQTSSFVNNKLYVENLKLILTRNWKINMNDWSLWLWSSGGLAAWWAVLWHNYFWAVGALACWAKKNSEGWGEHSRKVEGDGGCGDTRTAPKMDSKGEVFFSRTSCFVPVWF